MSIQVISFEGLNRSGKGTQIKMLEDHLISTKVPVVTMRGDGSRKGEGVYNDPYSKWWQNIQPYLRKVDENGSFIKEYWNLAAEKLNSEVYDMYHFEFPKIIKNSMSNKGVILLDRSIISRYFVLKRDNPNINLEDLMKFTDQYGVEKDVITPNLSFILHAQKDVLLERNEVLSDHPDKYNFRKKIITGNYDSFEDITNNLKSNLIRVVHLNGNRPQNLIFEEIKSFYKTQQEEK